MSRPSLGQAFGRSCGPIRPANWLGAYTNGDLLARAAAQFDAFITFDRNLPHQQNLSKYPPVVIVLRARTNNVADLAPLAPKILALLLTAPRGEATVIGL